MPQQRGYTLVEIMLALVIMLVVAGAMHHLLLSTQRLSRRQAGQAELQAALRAGTIAVAYELRELGPNDVVRMAPGAVTYRANRGLGFLCQPATATELRIARQGFTGLRDPQAGRDTAYVLIAEADSSGPWQPLAITAASTGNICPGGQAGVRLTIPAIALSGLEAGTPVRVTEVMELRLYLSEGKSWLGMRSVSAGEAVQPVLGPLADGNGLVLEYLSGAGTPAIDVGGIRGIRITLRAMLDGPMREESLATAVALRNTAQP